MFKGAAWLTTSRWASYKQEMKNRFLCMFRFGAIYELACVYQGYPHSAYKLYAKPNNAFMAARFKETFSREQAKVDFIGVW